MKKILIPCIFLIMPIITNGQLNGDGSSANPYYGNITSAIRWSTGDPDYGSTIYVGTPTPLTEDITIGNGGSLTIDPGITVIFTQLTSDLIITGSGNLISDGTAVDSIVFTKASGKDYWGHITFETPDSETPITGTGSFAYCRIEYGKTLGAFPKPNSAGGAIQINASGVTINNCTFKNNYARFGGAVTVNANQNTVIRNCLFKSNDAIECAGALLLHLNSTAIVENCIFEDNYCAGATQTYYGGGAIWSRQNTSKVVNCTFANNNSPRAGDAFFTFSSSNTRIINSIFWGSDDQISSYGTGAAYVNCAIQFSLPSVATNSFILSSDNASPNGPNFSSTDGSDWSVTFSSPCRDAGLNMYTGVTIPAYDYEGNPVIYFKDIGAYEIQYSRWTGTSGTDWSLASNWEDNMNPSAGSGDYVIPIVTNFPTATSITVNPQKFLILEPGAQLTTGSLSNSGTIRLKSGATGTASLKVTGAHSNSGDEIAELYLTGGTGSVMNNWHYISIPIDGHNIDSITDYTTNFLEYKNSLVKTSMTEGWHYYDDSPGFSTLTLGKGYNFYHSATTKNDYSFKGTFNTGSLIIPLDYDENVTAPDENIHGRNLVGNPFTSSIDWDVAADGLDEYTSRSIVFTSGDLGYVYYLADVGSPTPGVSNIIPPMQGFFMRTKNGSSVLSLDPATSGLLVHSNAQARFKKSSSSFKSNVDEKSMLRLKVADASMSDYALIWMNEKATVESDLNFDAGKFMEDRLTIWSSLAGKDFAINGIPYPDESQLIPLELNIKTAGTYTLSSETIQNLESYDITLIDKLLSTNTDLKANPTYTFTSPAEIITDRFEISFSNLATPVDNIPIPGKLFNIYQFNYQINVMPLSENIINQRGSLKVYNASGTLIEHRDKITFNKGELLQLPASYKNGLYIVEIIAGKTRYVEKIIFK